MGLRIPAALDACHDLTLQECERSRKMPPGRQNRRMCAVGPKRTGFSSFSHAVSRRRPSSSSYTCLRYSGIRPGEAVRATDGRLVTMELDERESALARETAQKPELADTVDVKVGDAVRMILDLPDNIDVFLVDPWKGLYAPCLDAIHPTLGAGAIAVADNIRADRSDMMACARAIRAEPDITSLMLPVEQGLDVRRFKEKVSNGQA